MPLATGTRLGPYEILARIGEGGMGEVWKARDTRLGRIVAIKRLKDPHGERFEQEARVVAALNHPNICQIHDVGPDFLVLEHIDGKPLQGPYPLQEAVRLAIQIASALEEAHGRGILHRDLKPANILVTSKGTAKLLDFGLAKLTTGTDAGVTKTLEGTVTGTAAYMAPEQAQGRPLDERCDIFSFGAVLYEMVSGNRAFSGSSRVDVLSAVVRDEPQPLQSSREVARLVMQCLRKAPSDRFQTMAEIKTALERLGAKPAEQQSSVAVLPFANMSADKEQEYFSDGLAEEIINALTQVPGLKVIARTSAFAFKGKNEDVRRIAEALGVTNVLEGSVRRAGNRLRVTAQLINAADGTHLWSQRYDREMMDVFAVQDEIATAIAATLKVKLRVNPAPTLRHEPNLLAYEAFLKGRHEFYKVSPEAYVRAEEYFQQAIALDPRWAEPHAYLGRQYFFFGYFRLRPVNEMVPLAHVEARKALELLPSEPIAHALLGQLASHDYDWRVAQEQFRLAMASEPFPPLVYDIYAFNYLLPMGRFEEALQERAKAIAQDPLNAMWRSRQAYTLLCAEKYELAIAEARKAMEIDGRIYLSPLTIALSCFLQGKPEEAREAAEDAFRVAPWEHSVVRFLAGLLAKAGERERAEELLATMPSTISAGMYFYHLVLSEIDAAIDCYERDIEQRNLRATLLVSAGFFKPLRISPRWAKLAKMMNLPGTI